MNWLKRFMNGRYGADQLNMFMLILSVLLTVIATLAKLPWLAFTAYVPLAVGIYRMFSKNLKKRSMENYRFSMMVSPVYSWFLRTRSRIGDSKTHRYFKCPNCRTMLRVPKGKGQIMITCPKCKTDFSKKT